MLYFRQRTKSKITFYTSETFELLFHSAILESDRQTSAELRTLRSLLGGVVVSVIVTGPKVSEFKPGRGDGLVRAKKSAARLPWDGK
jgi:hypothetical protein